MADAAATAQVVRNARASLAGIVAPSPNRSDRTLVLDRMTVYQPICAHFNWGEESPQIFPEEWNNLFFDLAVVSGMQKSSNLLVRGIANHTLDGTPLDDSLTYFAASFLLFYSLWTEKANMDARFGSSDMYHNSITLLFTLTLALLGWISPESDEEMSYTRLIGISALVILFVALEMLLYAEMYLQWFVVERDARTASYGWVHLLRTCCYQALFIATLVLAITETAPMKAIAFMLCAMSLTYIAFFTLRSLGYMYVIKGASSIPISIDYFLSRNGEFTMLCLGEGMIQLTMVDFTPTVDSIAAFLLSYFIIAVICLSHFSCMPRTAQETAYRRSTKRAITMGVVYNGYYMMLVAVGAGLSAVLRDPMHAPNWIICGALALVYLLLMCILFLHHGWEEEFAALPRGSAERAYKLWYLAWQFLPILAIFLGPLTGLVHWELLLYLSFWSLVFSVVKTLDYQHFWAWHCTVLETEIWEEKKKKLLATAELAAPRERITTTQ